MKLGIFTLIKDEQQYLDEWIQWHLNKEIDVIDIYEDFTSTSHKDICSKYENVYLHSITELLDESHANNQSRQLLSAQAYLDKNIHDLDWCFVIDVDEFIENTNPIKQILTQYDSEKSIVLNNKVYNANGYLITPHTSVVDSYKNWVDPNNIESFSLVQHFKCCINMHGDKLLKNIHMTYSPITTLGDENILNATYDLMWINHYFTKSWEEWKNTFKRGRFFYLLGGRNPAQFFELNPEFEKDKRILLPEMKPIICQNIRNTILHQWQAMVTQENLQKVR